MRVAELVGEGGDEVEFRLGDSYEGRRTRLVFVQESDFNSPPVAWKEAARACGEEGTASNTKWKTLSKTVGDGTPHTSQPNSRIVCGSWQSLPVLDRDCGIEIRFGESSVPSHRHWWEA